MKMFIPTTEFKWQRRTLSPTGWSGMLEDFDLIVDTVLHPAQSNSANFQPSFDVNETKSHYLVSFDIPGVNSEDIKIEVRGHELLIAGERRREMAEQDGEMNLHHEQKYGKFERILKVPSTIAIEKIEAQHANGVLTVALPKAETVKGRTIQIQTGQGGWLKKLLGPKKEPGKEIKDVRVY